MKGIIEQEEEERKTQRIISKLEEKDKSVQSV